MDAKRKTQRALKLERKKKLGGRVDKIAKRLAYIKDRKCSCDKLELLFSEKMKKKYGRNIKKDSYNVSIFTRENF